MNFVFVDFSPLFLLNLFLFSSDILLLQIPSAAKNSLGQSSHPTEAHQISITNPPCQNPSSSAFIVSPNSSSTLAVESISMQQSIFPDASTEFAQHEAVLLNSNTAPTFSTTKEIVSVGVSNDTNLFCKVCKVSCLSSFNYQQHVRGQKHKSKLKMQQQRQQQPRCNLCQIWCTDENNLKLHFDGQKHSAKLKETELQQKEIVLHQRRQQQQQQQQLWCELCQVPEDCISEEKTTRRENHTAT